MNIYIPNQNDIIHETSVDFVLRPCAKEIHIVQYDKSLPIVKVELFRNGERYALPENAAVNVRVGKLDHTFVYESILGTNEERNIVYFEVSEQMATIPGRIWPVLEVIETNKIACSSPLCFIIERNPIQEGQIESHDSFPIIYELQGIVADHGARISNLEFQVGNEVVTLHTNQYNIDGDKTFHSNVVIADDGILSVEFQPTLPSHVVNKNYVDAAIENIEMRSDVIDVLGTYQDLQNYDTTDVTLNDLVKIISDELHNDAISYYRWENISDINQWVYVASEGPFYTISEVNTIINRVDNDINDVDNRKLELHPFNGFVSGLQVHDQIQNGQIKYCQSGTQTTADPSQTPLINIELTQEHISSVSNKKAVYIKKIHIEYELDSEIGINKIWEYEFTSRIFGSGTNSDDIDPKVVLLSDITTGLELEWTLIYRPATGKKYYGSYSSTKGQQFGSNTNPSDYISLYTTSIQNATIKNVWVEVSGNSGTTAKIQLTLGQDQWTVNDIIDPNITSTNEQYVFYHEDGTHLGSGSGEIIEYNHVFLKKENDVVTSINAESEYLYIEEDSYRLYKYIDDQMQEVSKTRLGTTSDTAYRGDYGQDNYNKLQQVREQDFTFTGIKTFSDDVCMDYRTTLYVWDIKSMDEDGARSYLAEWKAETYYWHLHNIGWIGYKTLHATLIFMQSEKTAYPGSVVSPVVADYYRIMNLADPINDRDGVNKQYVDNNFVNTTDEQTITGNKTIEGNFTVKVGGGNTANITALGDYTNFGKISTFNSNVNVDGLIFAGGQELRFGGNYLNITDNTDSHNIIVQVNTDYVNTWRPATFLSNVKISAQNDTNPPILQTNFDREGGWAVFGRGTTFNSAAEFNGLIFAGGQELRFGGNYLNITDNTDSHNIIVQVNKDYVNTWKSATFLSNVKISAQNDADPAIIQTTFDREGGWVNFGRGATFNGAAEFNGLIFAGGREIRFPDYVDFKDNTEQHNTILKVDQNYINAERIITAKQGINIDVQPTEAQHGVRKDYVDNGLATKADITYVDAKVTANTAITGATKCKITYDAKGLVIAGADLTAIDIPSLDASKITSGILNRSRLPDGIGHDITFNFACSAETGDMGYEIGIYFADGSYTLLSNFVDYTNHNRSHSYSNVIGFKVISFSAINYIDFDNSGTAIGIVWNDKDGYPEILNIGVMFDIKNRDLRKNAAILVLTGGTIDVEIE